MRKDIWSVFIFTCEHLVTYCLKEFYPQWKYSFYFSAYITPPPGERGGSVVECRTPEREVRGSRPTAAVLCPWARHFTPRKYWLITQEAMAPSRYDWKIVDWDVKPQHNQQQPTPPPVLCGKLALRSIFLSYPLQNSNAVHVPLA